MSGIIIRTKKGDFGCFDARSFEYVLANYELELENLLDPAYRVTGKRKNPVPSDYASRKAMVEAFAIDYSYDAGDFDSSYLSLAIMGDLFNDLGKKYGLLTVFEENGIL